MSQNDRTHEPSGLLPTDTFSLRLRELLHNPGAVRTTSKIDLMDEYGHSTTWVLDTFRVEGGAETVFLQRISSGQQLREVLPPAVTAALAQQRDRATTKNRKRAARRAVATRIARGDTLGNPSALLKARKARSRKK
jgi:hypothetical protein